MIAFIAGCFSSFAMMRNLVGIVGTTLYIPSFITFSAPIINWFLLFHLSYYNLSYRIAILTSLIDSSSRPFRKLRSCGHLFDKLSQASNELASTFSFSVLLLLISLLVVCATSLFLGLFAMAPVIIENRTYLLILSFKTVLLILIIFNAADSPVTEVLNLLQFNKITLISFVI